MVGGGPGGNVQTPADLNQPEFQRTKTGLSAGPGQEI